MRNIIIVAGLAAPTNQEIAIQAAIANVGVALQNAAAAWQAR
jgi:hypothetical protein